MADELDMIRVHASPKLRAGEVALWEKDEEHPDGEIFIDNNMDKDGKPIVHEVAETPMVADAIIKGRLVRVRNTGGRPRKDAEGNEPGGE